MRLSPLQRFLLLECLNNRHHRLRHKSLLRFYDRVEHSPKKDNQSRNSMRDFAGRFLETDSVRKKTQQNAVTKSLERLIDKGLMIGYGRRTPRKWFIEEVALTPKGRKQARKLLGEQQSLPLKMQNEKSKMQNAKK